MKTYYRLINASERKIFWSILLSQTLILIVTWYFLQKPSSNTECYYTIAKNYSFVSPLIVLPKTCISPAGFWLRTNEFIIFSVFFLHVHLSVSYSMKNSWQLFIYMYTFVGLFFNTYQTQKNYQWIQRDAPFFILVAVVLLHLERKPFEDEQMTNRVDKIESENSERQMRLTFLKNQFFTDATAQIEMNDDPIDQVNILNEMNERIKEIESQYQPLEVPSQIPLEQNNKQRFVDRLLDGTLFLLFTFAILSLIVNIVAILSQYYRF